MEIEERKINFATFDDFVEYCYLKENNDPIRVRIDRLDLEDLFKRFSYLPENITLKEFIQKYSKIIYFAFLEEAKEIISNYL